MMMREPDMVSYTSVDAIEICTEGDNLIGLFYAHDYRVDIVTGTDKVLIL